MPEHDPCFDPDDDAEDEAQHLTVADTATRTVRVLSRRCGTCIMYRDDRMHMSEERRQAFIFDAVDRDTYVVCHSTLNPGILNAICRGFFDRYRRDITALRIVDRYGLAVEVDPPPEK